MQSDEAIKTHWIIVGFHTHINKQVNHKTINNYGNDKIMISFGARVARFIFILCIVEENVSTFHPFCKVMNHMYFNINGMAIQINYVI